MKEKQSKASGRPMRFILWMSFIVLCLLTALFIPWSAWTISSNPHPMKSYEEAAKQIESMRLERQSEMNPDCLLQFLTHGQKVQRVIILVHGYTSCPAQFGKLGRQFYELGYNVLIAPLPHHGLKDRMTDEHNQLTAKELASYTDKMIDLAHGLGEQIDMMGISAGGVVTAWAAQNRPDLDTAVMISPAFGFQQIPTRLTAPVMNITLLLPDTFVWWDANLKESIGPSHAYPRYSKHALAEILALGSKVQWQSRNMPPAAQRVIVITNANDTLVSNVLTAELIRRWQERDATIETYQFPQSLKLNHDLIDPEQPNQPVEIIYPQLINLITQEN